MTVCAITGSCKNCVPSCRVTIWAGKISSYLPGGQVSSCRANSFLTVIFPAMTKSTGQRYVLFVPKWVKSSGCRIRAPWPTVSASRASPSAIIKKCCGQLVGYPLLTRSSSITCLPATAMPSMISVSALKMLAGSTRDTWRSFWPKQRTKVSNAYIATVAVCLSNWMTNCLPC